MKRFCVFMDMKLQALFQTIKLCLRIETGGIFSVNVLSYGSVCTKQGTQSFSVVVQSLF